MTDVICDIHRTPATSSVDTKKEAEALKLDIASVQRQIDDTEDFELRRLLRSRLKEKRERLRELGEDDYLYVTPSSDRSIPDRKTSLVLQRIQENMQQHLSSRNNNNNNHNNGSMPSRTSNTSVSRSKSLMIQRTGETPATNNKPMGLIFKELYALAKDRPLPEFRNAPPSTPPSNHRNPFRTRAALQHQQSRDTVQEAPPLHNNSYSNAVTNEFQNGLSGTNGHHSTDTVSALVTSPLSNTIVEDGSKATLSCEFFMPPDTQLSSTVSWYKDRVLLALSEEFSQSVDRKDSDHVTATLHIREIFPDDEGEYSCIVKGHNWEVSSKARLTIADYDSIKQSQSPKKAMNGVHGITTKTSTDLNNTCLNMSSKDIASIEDEETLEKMLSATEDFEERKKIRAKLKELHEKKSAEWEKKRKEAEKEREDSSKMRQRHAEEAKQKKLQALSGPSANVASAGPSATEQYQRQKLAEAEADKQKRIEHMTQMGQANQALQNAGSSISTTAEKKAESKMKDVQPRPAVAKSGPRGAMQAFKKMDAATTPTGTGTKPNFASGGGGKGRAVQRSQSDIKQMLLNWVQAQTREYENIEIKNFSTSWSDGLAFCALIHHFYPDSFDYTKLEGKNPRANFQLAFDTAEKLADIAPLIEVDDMMKMHKNPDWKCVFVYVQSFYRRFYRQTMSKSSECSSDDPTTPTTPETPTSPAKSTSSESAADKAEQ